MFYPSVVFRFLLVVGCLLGTAPVLAEQPASPRIATVNGQVILARDLELELLISGKKSATEADRQAALNRVIDRALVANFLKKQNTKPLEEDVENLVERTRQGVQSGGETLEAVLERLKLTEEDVRAVARAAVVWESYVLRTVTQKDLQSHFEAHRAEFDGTKVHIRQIVRTVASGSSPADWESAEKLLADVRSQIEAKSTDFASAAMKHSNSPSGKTGGDIGLIRFQGDVPAAVSATAFILKDGEISQPIRSSVGVHLIQAIDRKPGDLSLEDARPALLKALGEQLWIKTVAELRSKAKINTSP